jgi:protein-disulfide isomerase-like protein with CxxC motif
MGPQWYQVRTLSGMPLEERLWYEDPPASSYPGCIAVKAAERQGPVAAERYLRLLREAVMLQRRNIARREVRTAIAAELGARLRGFDAARFAADLDNPAVLEAFRDDIKEVRYRNIGRFPTLIVQPAGGQAVMLVGFRPYDALRAALATLVPALVFTPAHGDAVEYLRTWGSATVQEITEMYGMDRGAADAALQAAVAAGHAERQGELYIAA